VQARAGKQPLGVFAAAPRAGRRLSAEDQFFELRGTLGTTIFIDGHGKDLD
jgi:hypothetical protein